MCCKPTEHCDMYNASSLNIATLIGILVLGTVIVQAFAFNERRAECRVLGKIVMDIHNTVLIINVVGGHELLWELATLAARKAGVIGLNVEIDREESAKVLEVFATRMLIDVAGRKESGEKQCACACGKSVSR